jgi:hypothetical protein
VLAFTVHSMRDAGACATLDVFVVAFAEKQVGVLDVRVERVGVGVDHLGVVRRIARLSLAKTGLAEVLSVCGTLHGSDDRPACAKRKPPRRRRSCAGWYPS